MDGDPSVEPEVDSFSQVLPLPYRVAIIIVLGMATKESLCEPMELTILQASGHGD